MLCFPVVAGKERFVFCPTTAQKLHNKGSWESVAATQLVQTQGSTEKHRKENASAGRTQAASHSEPAQQR